MAISDNRGPEKGLTLFVFAITGNKKRVLKGWGRIYSLHRPRGGRKDRILNLSREFALAGSNFVPIILAALQPTGEAVARDESCQK